MSPRKERYPSDMTDTEWAIIAPLIPPQRPGGRHRETDMREAMNAVRYVLRTGCQWRQLPKDFPPRSTVYNYFWEWTRYGVLDRIHHILLVKVREMEGGGEPNRPEFADLMLDQGAYLNGVKIDFSRQAP